jgi:plasmid stabilization system protein ParE
MDFQVIWAASGVRDFDDIIRYATEQSAAGAETLRDRILESIAVLIRMPYIGPVYERDRSGHTREILCGSYRIFYRVTETPAQVQVVRVWHGARKEPRLPPA